MRRPSRPVARPILGLVAAVLLVLPGAWPAGAGPVPPDVRHQAAVAVAAGAAGGSQATLPAGVDAGVSDGSPTESTWADTAGADGGGAPADATPDGPPEPSAEYLDWLAHARDRVDFQPGGRVTVPLRPRADDGVAPASAAVADGDVSASRTAPLAQAVSTVSRSGLHRAVLGFLPYWELSNRALTLDYRTLSTIAYFGVGCGPGGTILRTDPDGSPTSGWAGWTSSRLTSIIDTAHAAGTRVVLTLTCFGWTSAGATLQAGILTSPTYRSRLAAQLARAVHDRGADGVNLDVEPLVSGAEAGFVAFVRALRSALDAYASGYELTFDTMGAIRNYPVAAATAPGGADALMIMGYDYRGSGTAHVGSISPLNGPPYDLGDTIAAYLRQVPASKIILGLPYYGRAWSTDSSALHARNISGAKYGASVIATYATAAGVAAEHGRRWDPIEQSPWSAYRRQSCTVRYGCVTSWRQLYYDDVQSLARRYDLINRAGLRGAGIWALGYDGARPELRRLLVDKFLRDTTPPVVGIVALAPTQGDEGFQVSWQAYDDTGVASYDVQVSRDGGGWTAWLTHAPGTSGILLGATGHTYAFRVRATDTLGNTSAWAGTSVARLAAPRALAVGTFGQVTLDGLHMRASPDTSAVTMTTLRKGSVVYVTGGPRVADGYTWYRVNGPIGQWPTVDFAQLGGWVAVAGGPSPYVVPRAAPYATRVSAGLRGFSVGGGGDRVLTPNGDGATDRVRIDWTNAVAMDGLRLRVFRADGSLVGSRSVSQLAAGRQTLWWDGTLGGGPVPAGSYVLQLLGTRGAVTYTAPSAKPVTTVQLRTFGIAVGAIPPTSLSSFVPTAGTPTRSTSVGYRLVFGAAVTGLTRADLVRTGTATGCVVGTPTGTGASYAVTVSRCSAGTVVLSVRAHAVTDAVGNTGPAAASVGPRVVIDRTAPTTSVPSTALQAGTSLGASTAAQVAWTGTDTGGAGIATYDIARSVDGGAFTTLALAVATPSLTVGLASGHTYRFEVRARDAAGNVGAWRAGPSIESVTRQETTGSLAWSAGWRTAASASYSGGGVRYATTTGASVRYAFSGRAIAFVTSVGPNRGQVKLYLDGTYVTTLDLASPASTYGWVAWSRRWSSVGSHTIRLVVVGTPGRPRVDLDALVVLR